jgi:hypothetical protein
VVLDEGVAASTGGKLGQEASAHISVVVGFTVWGLGFRV